MGLGKLEVWTVLWLGLSACGQQNDLWQDATATSDATPPVLLHTQYGAFDLARQSLPHLTGTRQRARLAGAAHGLWLVQYRSNTAAAVRAALLELGVTVHGYFPDDAWAVSATAQQARAMATLDDVRAIAALPASLKLQQPMVTVTGRSLLLAPHTEVADLWVEMAQPADAAVIGEAVRTLGGAVLAEGSGLQILRVRLPQAGVGPLADMPEVLALEPWSMPQTSNDVSYGVIQSGQAGRSPVWNHGLRGQGQVIGLSDSGVDVHSCYFSGDKIAGYAEFTGIHDGDGTGHGTHVAGSIAGNMGGDALAHPHDGMAPAARLFVEDVGAGADLVGIPGDLSVLFGPAYAAGARIHSNSWVGGSTTYGVMSRALDRFVAQHPDFLPLFAAGNTGRHGRGQVLEPALAKNVVAVGALDGAQPDSIADFSSRGPTADGRIKPAIAAPGVRVVSAQAGAACATQVLSGTSMATPTAAGGVALVRQYYTEGYYPTGTPRGDDRRNPSAALLKATLIAGAVDMSRGQHDGSQQGADQGFGRMQLDNTLVFDAHATRLWLQDETWGVGDGESMTFTVHIAREKQPLRVALTWTDPPALPGAGRALVDDLDLEVTGPDGVLYRGNAIVDGESTPGADRDSDNVEELVALSAAMAGDWQVTVRGTHVPMGPQGFALVSVGNFVR